MILLLILWYKKTIIFTYFYRINQHLDPLSQTIKIMVNLCLINCLCKKKSSQKNILKKLQNNFLRIELFIFILANLMVLLLKMESKSQLQNK